MGGSKKQTIGYRYLLGVHAVFMQMAADSINRIQFDKKDAWVGRLTDNGTIDISKESLFGGDSREGGVSGTVEFLTGKPTQGRSAYLQSQLGSAIPAFRGVTSLVFRGNGGQGFYWGMNPYLKQFSAEFTRIHKTTDAAVQWYDAKADVRSVVPNAVATVLEQGITLAANVYAGPGFGGPGNSLDFSANPEDVFTVESLAGAWSRWGDDSYNGGMAWTAGFSVTDSGGTTHMFYDNPPFAPPDYYPTEAAALSAQALEVPVSLTGFDKYSLHFNDAGPQPTQDVNRGSMTFKISLLSGYSHDMNPAHIIRECLVDPDWGMGYLPADIDDTSFMAAADQLYNEGMGISIPWDEQMTIEDFIKEIARHINGVVYVSRSTGKFVLKLIRADYVVDDLRVLGAGDFDKISEFKKRVFGELVNSVTVSFWDNSVNDTGTVTESDPALVAMQGGVIGTTVQYPGFTNSALADRVAYRDLGTLSTELRSCKANAKWATAKDLNVGDVFVLDWPDVSEPWVARITGMSLGDGKSNKIQLILTEDVFGLPVTGAVQQPTDGFVNPIQAPAALSPRAVFEMPYLEAIQRYGQAQVDDSLDTDPDLGYIQTAGGQSGSSGLNYILDVDSGAGYVQHSPIDICPAAFLDGGIGPLTTAIPLRGATAIGLVPANTYAKLGDEWIEFVSWDAGTAMMTAKRGLMDSVPTTHADGDAVLFVDNFSGSDETQYNTGETVNAKMLMVTGLGTLDEGAAPVDLVTLAGRAALPYPPGNVKIGGAAYPATVSGTFTVTWAHRNRKTQADQFVDTTQPDVTPAPNTRYGLRFLDAASTLLIERTDIGPGTADVTLNVPNGGYGNNYGSAGYGGAAITMELYTIDNTGASLQRHSIVFAYTPPGGSPTNTITATAYTPVDDSTIIDGGP